MTFNKAAPVDDNNALPVSATLAGGALSLKDSISGFFQRMFIDPNNEAIVEVTSLRSYFSDDFGGNALDLANRWIDLNGGLGALDGVLPANQVNGAAQAAIGTGIAGITFAVAASALTFTFGTTTNAERWLLSQAMFCCSEDILIVLSRSQALAANSIQIGLVEVDKVTGWPILNPNLAADFTNRVTMEFGQTVGTQTANLRTVADSSPAETAFVAAAFAPAAMTAAFETLIQVRAEDVHALSAIVDTAAAKTTVQRVSSQVPNDTKVYRLLIRMRNIGTPGSSTTVAISRIMVQNHQALNVSVVEASGSVAGSQGLPVTLVNNLPASAAGGGNAPLIGRVTGSQGFTDTSTPLTGAATFTGTGRVLGSMDSYSMFGATAYADVAGTLYIDMSSDTGSNWHPIAQMALPAGTVGFGGDLAIRIRGTFNSTQLYRARFVNGAGAQATFRLISGFTIA